MKAAQIHDYESEPVIEDIPTPDIGADDVLVRVAAASMNPLDVKLQKGYLHDFFPLEFPYTMGTDLAGTIEQVGSKVTGWSENDKVVARVDPTSGGAMAELAVVPASYLVSAPTSVSIERAAGIPTTGGTAWQALFDVAGLQRDQTVLVHAGAGGVGSFAIQFAHAAGARVIATASGTGIDLARRLGADEVIDYRSHDFTEMVSDVDVVLDTVGGETQQRSVEVVRPGGVLVSVPAPPEPGTGEGRDVKVLGIVHNSDAALLKKVVDSVAGGTEILVDRTVPLGALKAAFAHQASGHAHGKILLTI